MTASADRFRVICVDRDEDAADTTAAALEDQTERIRASGAVETDRVLAAVDDGFDCVVTRQRLSGATGMDLLSRIRKVSESVPVIVYADTADGAAVRAVARATAARYVPGDLPVDVVADRVLEAVRNARSHVQLEGTRETYRSLLDAAPVPVWVQGLETIYYANQSAAELYGVDRPDALIGESALQLVPESDQPDVLAANRRMLETDGAATALEGPFLRVDGEERYGLYAGACITYRGEDALVVIARDITDRQAETESLREQNERLEEFASVLSHDIRNPLSVAASSTEEVRRRLESVRDGPNADTAAAAPGDPGITIDVDALYDFLEMATDAHKRMDEITDRLLRLARNGRTVESPQSVSLEHVARNAWSNVETGTARLSVDSDRQLLADSGRVTELFENVFANAHQHGDATDVHVRATADGFVISDDGVGISPTVRERAFDYGYTTASEGTGFGLAIVERIASAHGWSVRFGESGQANEAPGEESRGTEVVVEGLADHSSGIDTSETEHGERSTVSEQ